MPPVSHYIVCHLPPRTGSPVPFHSFEFPGVTRVGGGIPPLGPRMRARPSIRVIPWTTSTAVLGPWGQGGGGDSLGVPRVHDSAVPLHVTARLDQIRLRERMHWFSGAAGTQCHELRALQTDVPSDGSAGREPETQVWAWLAPEALRDHTGQACPPASAILPVSSHLPLCTSVSESKCPHLYRHGPHPSDLIFI